mmetsp:Transcript_3362/g.7525  ORF Transcript_3362/g.7525 Transcript_3362/m.7525 type:complete len:1031 (+) Transcript_3362:907-3999(+)
MPPQRVRLHLEADGIETASNPVMVRARVTSTSSEEGFEPQLYHGATNVQSVDCIFESKANGYSVNHQLCRHDAALAHELSRTGCALWVHVDDEVEVDVACSQDLRGRKLVHINQSYQTPRDELIQLFNVHDGSFAGNSHIRIRIDSDVEHHQQFSNTFDSTSTSASMTSNDGTSPRGNMSAKHQTKQQCQQQKSRSKSACPTNMSNQTQTEMERSHAHQHHYSKRTDSWKKLEHTNELGCGGGEGQNDGGSLGLPIDSQTTSIQQTSADSPIMLFSSNEKASEQTQTTKFEGSDSLEENLGIREEETTLPPPSTIETSIRPTHGKGLHIKKQSSSRQLHGEGYEQDQEHQMDESFEQLKDDQNPDPPIRHNYAVPELPPLPPSMRSLGVLKARGWLWYQSRMIWQSRFFMFFENGSLVYYPHQMTEQEARSNAPEGRIDLTKDTIIEKTANSTLKRFRFSITRRGNVVARLAAESVHERDQWCETMGIHFRAQFAASSRAVTNDVTTESSDKPTPGRRLGDLRGSMNILAQASQESIDLLLSTVTSAASLMRARNAPRYSINPRILTSRNWPIQNGLTDSSPPDGSSVNTLDDLLKHQQQLSQKQQLRRRPRLKLSSNHDIAEALGQLSRATAELNVEAVRECLDILGDITCVPGLEEDNSPDESIDGVQDRQLQQGPTPALHLLFDEEYLRLVNDDLHGAARRRIVELLVRHNPRAASIRIQNCHVRCREGDYVLHAELRRAQPDLCILEAILQTAPEALYRSNELSGEYPIHLACSRLQVSAVRVLLRHDRHCATMRNGKTLDYPIHAALNPSAPEGFPSGRDFAIAYDKDVLQIVDALAHTFHRIIQRSGKRGSPHGSSWQRDSTVSSASSTPDPLESTNASAQSVLHLAARFHSARVVRCILKLAQSTTSADRLLETQDHDLSTPLHVAAARVNESESLVALDVFSELALHFYHVWPDRQGASPADLITDIPLRRKMTARFRPRSRSSIARVSPIFNSENSFKNIGSDSQDPRHQRSCWSVLFCRS